MSVQAVKIQVERHLNQIKPFFVEGMELTFIARKPDNDRADFVVTNDSLAELAKVVERMQRQSGQESEIATLRDLERSYSQQLGEMARLADIVCRWATSDLPKDIPKIVVDAAEEIMEYVEAVRPPAGSSNPEWVMHILGPDDVIPCVSQFDALRQANEHNKVYANWLAENPSPYNPYAVAVSTTMATLFPDRAALVKPTAEAPK